jgi:chorismate mutase
MIRAVRGAIQVAENAPGAIGAAVTRLVAEMLRVNVVAEEMIVSLIFSVTEDLTAANPATALRGKGFAATPLFCTQEARVDGGMPRVIRVLLTWEQGAFRREAVPVYLDGAELLRADLGRGERP